MAVLRSELRGVLLCGSAVKQHNYYPRPRSRSQVTLPPTARTPMPSGAISIVIFGHALLEEPTSAGANKNRAWSFRRQCASGYQALFPECRPGEVLSPVSESIQQLRDLDHRSAAGPGRGKGLSDDHGTARHSKGPVRGGEKINRLKHEYESSPERGPATAARIEQMRNDLVDKHQSRVIEIMGATGLTTDQ